MSDTNKIKPNTATVGSAIDSPAPTPKLTPKTKAATTPKKRTADTVRDDETPSSKRRYKPVATNASDLSEEDLKLIEWREAGKNWVEINELMEEYTGEYFVVNSLRKRHTRVIASIASVNNGDRDLFLATVPTIQAEVEGEKRALDRQVWARVSAMMAQGGAIEKYEAATLEKEWKKLHTPK